MTTRHAFPAEAAPRSVGTDYPAPFDRVAPTRVKHALGRHAGLTQYGVNLVSLPPGEASALRHWHRLEDEFVHVLSGEVVLVTDDGEEVMTAGMSAGFPAGVENGHHLLNRSAAPAVYLEVGSRRPGEEAHYPDDDLHALNRDGEDLYTDKAGRRL